MILVCAVCAGAVRYYSLSLDRVRSDQAQRHTSVGVGIASSLAGHFIKKDFERGIETLKSLNRDRSIVCAVFYGKNHEYIAGYLQKNGNDRITSRIRGLRGKENYLRSFLEKTPNEFARSDVYGIKFLQRGSRDLLGGVKLAVSFDFNRLEEFFLYSPVFLYGFLTVFAMIALGNILLSAFKRRPKERFSDKTFVVVEGGGRENDASRERDGADIFTMDVGRIQYPQTEKYAEEYLDLLEGWKPLFNGFDLEEWEKDGSFYVSNKTVVAEPYKASAVRSDIEEDVYEYKFKARKIAGADGFVALFRCSHSFHAWIIGGWQNRRSEVMRVGETVSDHCVSTGTWYDIRIAVLEDKAEGFLDNVRVWSVDRKTLEGTPSQDAFLKGIGVGVWNTLSKFKDIHILVK